MNAPTTARSVPLVVRVDPELAERVRAAAAIEHRTVSSFGLVALERAVADVLADEELREWVANVETETAEVAHAAA